MNIRHIHLEPNHDHWCGCLHDRRLQTHHRICSGECAGEVCGKCGIWFRSSTHQSKAIPNLHCVAQFMNLRNIHLEPSHDRWCRCLHDRLLQTRHRMCSERLSGMRVASVRELVSVVNASKAIPDFHLLHHFSEISDISI